MKLYCIVCVVSLMYFTPDVEYLYIWMYVYRFMCVCVEMPPQKWNHISILVCDDLSEQ